LNKEQEVAEDDHEDSAEDNVEIQPKEDIRFKSGAIYTGVLKDDTPHGDGEMKWEDGATYKGEWTEGKANGKGKFTSKDGQSFEMHFENNKAI
jgi:hypothetical protein